MRRYSKPQLRVYAGAEIVESLGLVCVTNYTATVNVYGGRTSCLHHNQPGEYRIAKVEVNHGLVSYQEVAHA